MNAQTLSKMKQMKLYGMAGTFAANVETGKWEKYTADELISLLIEAEWDERHNRKLDRSLKTARFRYKASVEQLSFDMERNLDKNQIMRLADCEFIKRKENILIKRAPQKRLFRMQNNFLFGDFRKFTKPATIRARAIRAVK